MPKSATPTIYDVSRVAKVSIATVSRVLNNPAKVNPETRAAVMAAINSLGFTPKADARARALKDHRRIGVITPFFTAPSFVQRLRGVAAALQNTRYELVIYTVQDNDRLHSYLETLPLTGNLDGLLILSLQFDEKYARGLVEAGMETVMVEYPHPMLNSIEIDNEEGGHLAARYLHGKGYRTFGFVGDTYVPEFGIHPITLRLSGFRKELEHLGTPLRPEFIFIAPYDIDKTRELALQVLSLPERPQAIFAATDIQAIAILQACRELKISVPRDLAVIGFDDLDVAEYFGLTTIRQHLDESGRAATELLLTRLAEPQRPIQHIQLPLDIIERQTT